MGFINRVTTAYKAFIGDSAPATQKSYGLYGDNWITRFGTTSNGDISADKYGYAQAYSIVEAVRVCVDFYADNVESIRWELIENTTPDGNTDYDSVVASSDDVKPRHVFDRSLSRYRRTNNISLIRHIMFSTLLYDETYIYMQPNEAGYRTGLHWLNPLGMQVDDYSGYIKSFRYSGQGANGVQTFTPDEIAYDHGVNPFKDDRGMSIILAALDDININRNADRFLRAYFANNSRPDFMITLDDDRVKTAGQANEVMTRFKDEFDKFLRGVDNRGNGFFSPIKALLTPFEQPKIWDNYQTNQEVRKRIYAAFKVPLALVGDNGATTYKDSDNLRNNWIMLHLRPYLMRLQDFFNDSILPRMTGSSNYRFEFDLSDYVMLSDTDMRKAELARVHSG